MITPDGIAPNSHCSLTVFYNDLDLPSVCLVATYDRFYVGWVRDWVPTTDASTNPFEGWAIWSGDTEDEAAAYLRSAKRAGVMPFVDAEEPEAGDDERLRLYKTKRMRAAEGAAS